MDAEGKRRVKCPRASSLIVGFLCCISLGCTLTFPLALNVLFIDWMTTFSTSRGALSSVHAVCTGMLSSGGLLAALLERRLGRRTCFILGSVLATVGLFSGAFANSVPVLILTVGVVAGSGFSLSYLSTLSTAMTRFSAHSGIISSAMSTVSGLMHLGTPILYRYLSDQYSWRGCLMIVAGMLFQTVILGVLITSSIFSAPKGPRDRAQSVETDDSPHQIDTIAIRLEDVASIGQNYVTEDGISNSECSITPDKPGIKAAENTNVAAREYSLKTECSYTEDRCIDTRKCTIQNSIRETECSIVSDEHTERAPDRENVEAIEHSSNKESPATMVLSAGNLRTDSSSGCSAMSAVDMGLCTNGPRSSNVNTEESHHTETRPSQWTFLKNPVYVLTVLVFSLTTSAQFAILILVLDLALNKGWTVDDGLVLNFSFMVGSLIGRPVVGLASLNKTLNSVILMTVCGIVGAVGTGPMGFVTEFYVMALLFFLMGFSFGSLNAIYASAVLYVAGKHSYSLAQGCLNTVQGPLEMGLGALTGVLVDRLGSYLLPCAVYGVIGLTVSIVLIMLECCRNPCRRDQAQNSP